MSETSARQILIIGPDSLSDLFCAQALCKQFHSHYPDGLVDIVTSKHFSGLLKYMPEFHTHFEFDTTNKEFSFRTFLQLGKTLKQKKYDHVIVLAQSYRMALLAWLARIPHRTGFGNALRVGVLNDIRSPDNEKFDLRIQKYVALAFHFEDPDAGKKIPLPTLKLDSNFTKTIQDRYQLQSDKPILAICPGTTLGDTHRWPAKYFASVANEKFQNDWQVWIVGDNCDQTYAAEIQTRTNRPCTDLTGRLSLKETIALLSLAKQVVTNESVWMHICSVLNKPVVAIYGAHHPTENPPLSKSTRILSIEMPCKPCNQMQCPDQHYRCLRDILPETVVHHLTQFEKNTTPS